MDSRVPGSLENCMDTQVDAGPRQARRLRSSRRLHFLLVMMPTGKHPDFLFGDLINKAMLLIDAPGPTTRKLIFQRFRLFGSLKGIPLDFLCQPDCTQGLFCDSFYPPRQVFGPVSIKLQASCRLRQEASRPYGLLPPIAVSSLLRF